MVVEGASSARADSPPAPIADKTVEPVAKKIVAKKRARPAELSEAIDELPVIARIDDAAPTAFILRGRLTKKRSAAMERMAKNIIADVARRFVGNDAEGAKDDPVDVCLFENDADYSAFSQITGDRDTMLGFHLPGQRLIVANLGRSVGNLRHELVHPLMGDAFASSGRALPAWFNEGLGSLYGSSRVRKDNVTFLVNYRLRDVRKAIRAGNLPTLQEISESGRAELYGNRSMTYYGTARYLLLYMAAEGTLGAFYRDLQSEEATADRQHELLEKYVDEKRFVRWTRRLKSGRRATKPR